MWVELGTIQFDNWLTWNNRGMSWSPELLSLAPDLLLSLTEVVVFVLTLDLLIKRDVSHVKRSRGHCVSSVMLTFTLLPP